VDFQAEVKEANVETDRSQAACKEAEQRHQNAAKQVAALEGSVVQMQHELATARQQQSSSVANLSRIKKELAGAAPNLL
jgi:peptidoglycan hydrolase CwlO-like protein